MSSNLARRRDSAERFRPSTVDCLFVAEAPPADESRYFYFEDFSTGDSLYLEVSKALFKSLNVDRLRAGKATFLERLRDQGLWLIDLSEDPIPGRASKSTYLQGWVDSLVDRCREINPRRVILLATSVYDSAYERLDESGVPVVDVRMPFPGSGRQKEFRAGFWEAIRRSSLNPDPVVLDGNCISYWLDALDHISAPDKEDKLASQKLSLVRMFYYWPWVLSYTQGVRSEVEDIADAERLARHEQWMDIHLRELPDVDTESAAPIRERLVAGGINKKDAIWMAEAIVIGAPLVITWDQALLAEASGFTDIEVTSPEGAWAALSVPSGTDSRIRPTESNPLSQEDWWLV